VKSATPVSKIKTEFSLRMPRASEASNSFWNAWRKSSFLRHYAECHPLLAFEGPSRLCLGAVLRTGNTHSSTDATSFLNETFGLLCGCSVKYARFDKGFGGEEFYSLWEGKKIGYVGKLKWTQRLAAQVAACRYWKRFVDED
jgi:hypothetical protein